MRAKPSSQQVSDYVAALIQSSSQISAIVQQMERFARRSGQRKARPTVAVLAELLEGIVSDPALELNLAGVEAATELLVSVTDAVGQNLFFVDPDELDDVA